MIKFSLFRRAKKKKTHADVIAPLTSIADELEALAQANRDNIVANVQTIAQLTQHNGSLSDEAARADSSKKGLAALLGK